MVNRAMNIIVTNYDENWPELFKKEASHIQEILKNEIVEIHHIGSTAVPNLKAKPIIDIMPTVKNIEVIDRYNEKMKGIGYEPLGEFGIKGRRYFRKGGENRTHQIHIFQFDNKFEIERHLAVRDYLKSHNQEAAAYGELKEQLAIQFPKDIEGYSLGKEEFVEGLEQRALAWLKEKNNKF
ncbi:GrpB family protein [Lederbergia panacisoli]|uniref:GrpB family protein n=1 Tax=Lederbergia panacisoli TaxID=1255251 RepID=UPI00214ACE0D|nr:GrpB family protein [Lederbergia panacisoli]MCR2822264.1 GrpB family protein [Lederbergia panacisoli]